MTVVVFCGPTLSAEEVHRVLPDAICLPPAAHGDIYRAASARHTPRVIGLIDGYFRTVPAVRHKEILWAMAQGVHVFGAASMGALRAAELADFGMVGVGSIFDDLQSGRLEDDDEVAVDHGPVELNYCALNEAMVDVRATMEAAAEASVVTHDTANKVRGLAKALPYAERGYLLLLNKAAEMGVPAREIDNLREWLVSGKISFKRFDARKLLEVIRDFIATNPPPLSVSYHLERTEFWERDRTLALAIEVSDNGSAGSLLVEDILDELRLAPGAYDAARRAALGRALALREVWRQGIELTADERDACLRSWLRERQIGLRTWLEVNHLDENSFAGFIEEEALIRKLEFIMVEAMDAHLLDALRAKDTFSRLKARALEKRAALLSLGKLDATLDSSGIALGALLHWFTNRIINDRVPGSQETLAMQLGFNDVSAFTRALLREYYFMTESEKEERSHRN
jgi:hypothetical protein